MRLRDRAHVGTVLHRGEHEDPGSAPFETLIAAAQAWRVVARRVTVLCSRGHESRHCEREKCV